jgi:hypothetical protein
MDEFRLWWASAVRTSVAWVSQTWQRFAYNVMHEWDVLYFVLGLGIVLFISLSFMARRRA